MVTQQFQSSDVICFRGTHISMTSSIIGTRCQKWWPRGHKATFCSQYKRTLDGFLGLKSTADLSLPGTVVGIRSSDPIGSRPVSWSCNVRTRLISSSGFSHPFILVPFSVCANVITLESKGRSSIKPKGHHHILGLLSCPYFRNNHNYLPPYMSKKCWE